VAVTYLNRRRDLTLPQPCPNLSPAPTRTAVCESRFQERSQKTYKARDAFLALVVFELPMGFLFGVLSYLVMWAPVGWDYKVTLNLPQPQPNYCAQPLGRPSSIRSRG